MGLSGILEHGAVVFLDSETDFLITWDGGVVFQVFAGKFNGDYDNIETFHRDIKTVAAAREAAAMWFRELARFNPGP